MGCCASMKMNKTQGYASTFMKIDDSQKYTALSKKRVRHYDYIHITLKNKQK